MDSAQANIVENSPRRYLWHGKDHDDLCYACGNPGELLECDDCPRVYHLVCIGLEDVPSGKYSCPWHICSECQRFTSADTSLAVACCCACSTCFCIPCAPASVRSRFGNPNLAHMANKSDLNTYLAEINVVGSSNDQDMISRDYLTDGGSWCSMYLPSGSVVYMCSSCEVNAAQEIATGDIFRFKSSPSRDALGSSSSQNANFLPSHRLLEAFLGASGPGQHSNNGFFPPALRTSVNAPSAESSNVVVAQGQCQDDITSMDVAVPQETVPFVKSEDTELTEEREDTQPANENLNIDSETFPTGKKNDADETAESFVKEELGESVNSVDNDSKMVECPLTLPESEASGGPFSEKNTLVYGKSDPQINLEALKDAPVECVRVGESSPLYRWKNILAASNDVGQDASFVNIAAHSFERFKMNFDDKVKLAFGLVWRHCDIQDYENAFQNSHVLHLSVIRQEIKTFWLQRAVIAEQKQDYTCAKKSLEYMRAVPGGLTLEMSSIQYRISTEANKHGASALGLESFPVDIYHEDSQQFMYRFDSLSEAINIMKLQALFQIPLAEIEEKLLLTMSGDGRDKLKRSPFFSVFWFSSVEDGLLRALAAGKTKYLPKNASLKPAPPKEAWFDLAEIHKIMKTQVNFPTRSLTTLRKEQNLLKTHRNVLSFSAKSPSEADSSESSSNLKPLQVAHALKMVKYYEHREIADLLNDLTMIVYFSDRDRDVENRMFVYNPMLSLNPDDTPPPAPQLASSESGVECISKHDMRTLGVVQSCVEAAAVCKSSLASVYNSVRSHLTLACGGFLWRNTSNVPERYFRVPFRRAELSSNNFPRLPAVRTVPAKTPPNSEAVEVLPEIPTENVPTSDMVGPSDSSILPVPLEELPAGQITAKGRRKLIDVRSSIDGPVLRRFSCGADASGILLMNQTQISTACCTNARKIFTGQPVGKALGLIFTFSDDTYLTSTQGAQVEIQNVDQKILIDLLEGFRRRRKTSRARSSARLSSGDDSADDNEIERPKGKRQRKRPQHGDMFISTDAAMAYVDRYESLGPTRRKPTAAYSDEITYAADEGNSLARSTQMWESAEPQKPPSGSGSAFMLHTERRLPVIGRSHQANIPVMLNQRTDEDSEPDDAVSIQLGPSSECVWSCKFDDAAVGLSGEFFHRVTCSQYIPGLIVHLAKESTGFGEMAVGVVIEEPAIDGTIKLSDGRIIHDVPTSFIQQVVPVDKILRCCNQMLTSNAMLDEAELVRQVRELASEARSRQLVASQVLHFFDAVEQHGSNIQQVFRALRPLTARTCSVGALKSDDLIDFTGEQVADETRQNLDIELSLPVSPKRLRVSDQPGSEAVSPTLSLASQAARSKDGTRSPDVREVISLFHLLKNILPCRQYEDEFHALKTGIRVFAETENAQDSSAIVNDGNEVMVFGMKDAQQKLRRAQVLSAHALAEKMNNGLL